MDWRKYANELETIIDAIDMNEHQRILVNGLMKAAKQNCEISDNEDQGYTAMQSGKPA